MNIHSTILIAEDDDDDIALLKYAFTEVGIKNPLCFAENGEKLIAFLKSAEAGDVAMPAMVFLDLNMPKINGREVLKLMKDNLLWKSIPVLVFSTSDFDEDVKQVYALGAAGYIVKPSKYAELIALAKIIKEYWIESVMLP